MFIVYSLYFSFFYEGLNVLCLYYHHIWTICLLSRYADACSAVVLVAVLMPRASYIYN